MIDDRGVPLLVREHRQRTLNTQMAGFTMFELIVVMSLIAILGAIAVVNLRSFDNALAKGTFSVEQFLQTARSTAISGTQVIRVQPGSSQELEGMKGTSCDGAATPVEALELELPSGVSLIDTNWFLCFNSRGLADANVTFSLTDGTATNSVSVALGGGVRITD